MHELEQWILVLSPFAALGALWLYSRRSSKHAESELSRFIRNGDLASIRRLLKRNPFIDSSRDRVYRAALEAAADAGQSSVLELLFEKDVFPVRWEERLGSAMMGLRDRGKIWFWLTKPRYMTAKQWREARPSFQPLRDLPAEEIGALRERARRANRP